MDKDIVSLTAVTHEIFSGFSFRGKVKNEPEGALYVLQVKDLENDYTTISPHLTRVHSHKISSRLFLGKGDVLFLAKGANNYAITYDLDLPKAIASSAFFVLRPDEEKVVPSYLSWFINQLPVQLYLKENMAGSYIPNINKSTLEGIMVSLPSIDIQKKIVMVDNLRRKEHLLVSQIMKKREVAVRTALLDIVTK